jgi:hypothetical protein
MFPGVSEILAEDSSSLLVLERNYSESCGNTIQLFRVNVPSPTPGAATVPQLEKKSYLDLGAHLQAFADTKLRASLDNFEALGFGPVIDNRSTLLLASDDNQDRYRAPSDGRQPDEAKTQVGAVVAIWLDKLKPVDSASHLPKCPPSQ